MISHQRLFNGLARANAARKLATRHGFQLPRSGGSNVPSLKRNDPLTILFMQSDAKFQDGSEVELHYLSGKLLKPCGRRCSVPNYYSFLRIAIDQLPFFVVQDHDTGRSKDKEISTRDISGQPEVTFVSKATLGLPLKWIKGIK